MPALPALEIIVALIQVALAGLLAWGGLLSWRERRREARDAARARALRIGTEAAPDDAAGLLPR